MVVPAASLGPCSGIIRFVRPGFEVQGFCCKLLSYAKVLFLSNRKVSLVFKFQFEQTEQGNKTNSLYDQLCSLVTG